MCPRRRTIERHGSTSTPSLRFNNTARNGAIGARIAEQRLAADAMRDLPDGLHVGICGAGPPFTDGKRSGPRTLVVAGKRLFVADTGSGSARVIGKMGFNHGRVGAIFLTHFYSDHIDDLGTLMLQRWVSVGNTAPVPVTTRDA